MRKDQEFIFRLRHEGRSFREIQEATGVSRGTLSKWFRDQDWSKAIKYKLSEKNPNLAKERMERMNIVRKLKLQYVYALVASEATKEYEQYENDFLFLRGLDMYKKHGNLTSKHLISLSSGFPKNHIDFRLFCQKYLNLKENNIKFGLYIYSNLDKDKCLLWWSKELGLDILRFYKTQVIKRQITRKGLQFGVGTTIISSTALKVKLKKWLDLRQDS